MSKLPGVHAPHRKNTAEMAAVRMPVPAMVTIPMSMHIGAPAKPIVKMMDLVKVGQPIAEAGGFVSAPIHSSVSGKVKAVDSILMSDGRYIPAVTIETDGLQEVWEGVKAPEVTDFASFVEAVRQSGAVGLGGAGFPTSVKLGVKDLSAVEHIIINGAECEPYITSDTRTMIDDADLMVDGIKLLQKFMGVKSVIIGIEDNKKEAIEVLNKKTAGMEGVKVAALPALYPQGGEKVLIYHTTGRVVPEGGLPLNVGCIVMNCTTLAIIAKYVQTGMPLVEKCVTVDGPAVASPKNVIVPIGTAMQEVFDFAGGFKAEPRKVIYGGPMMGIAVPDLTAPILKTTNAIVAFDEKSAEAPKETACIRCGRCVAACPFSLMPAAIEGAQKRGDGEKLEALKVNLCMECGCCSFVCPAKRNLVQTNKLGKMELRKYQEAKKAENK